MKCCCRKCTDELKKKRSRETRICLECKQPFNVRKKETKKLCSEECRAAWASRPENVESRIESSKQAVKDKFGVENVFQLEEVKEKSRQTKLEKYGDENYNNPESQKETLFERHGDDFYFKMAVDRVQTFRDKYGVDHPLQSEEFRAKRRQTNQERYGVDNVSQDSEIKKRRKKTYRERYGVDNPSQVEEFKEKKKQTSLENFGVTHHLKDYDRLQKHLKAQYKVKEYKDTGIHYQGSYELLFLELLEEKGLLGEVSDGRSYDYEFFGEKHVYHTDFLFRGQEIEIKSSWTYDHNGADPLLRELNETKWKAVRDSGEKLKTLIDKEPIRVFVNGL